jgi:glucose-6-phosphate 1-epimerase
MHYPDIATLNTRFGARGRIAFRAGENGLPIAALAGVTGSCEVSLYGGHVLSYRPAGHLPVLFMSKSSRFEPGKPIRGGIPVCWPWFGPHPTDPALPAHGFARIVPWRLAATEYTSRSAEIRLALDDTAETRGWWPHRFSLTLRVALENALKVELTTRNTDTHPFTFSEALHSYFGVRQIMDVILRGLEGAAFTDVVTGAAGRPQETPLVIRQEVDRVYAGTEAECVIDDAGLERQIVVAKRGSRTTVVWNPWIDKAKRLPDFGDEEYTRMVCVETANAGANAITLEPGKSHTLAAVISADAKAE